jgi:ribose transport system substrate-binding protein
MNKTSLVRSPARIVWLTVFLLLVAACAGDGGSTTTTAGQETTTTAGQETTTTAGQETTTSSSAESAEKMTVEEVEAELGPVPQPSRAYLVAAITKTQLNEFDQQMKVGYDQAAADYGLEMVVQSGQDESDLTGQLAIGETLLAQGFDIFAVSPISPDNMQPFLEAAAASGFEVVNVGDARVDTRVFVGADQRDGGVLAAQLLAELLPDGGEVAQVEGAAASDAAIARIEGFTTELANFPQFELVASVPGEWDRQIAFDAATNILVSNPEIKAFFANNDTMALGIVEALREAGLLEDVIVIGIDGTPEAVAAVRSGEMAGTVAAFPSGLSYAATEVAIRVLEGQNVPRWVVTPQIMITPANVDEHFPE